MTFFRKKPVTVEARKWTGGNVDEVYDFMHGDRDLKTSTDRDRWGDYVAGMVDKPWPIKTLEGVLNASVGDWIIKGVDGEFYPCKPDIFTKTYEPTVVPASDCSLHNGPAYPPGPCDSGAEV